MHLRLLFLFWAVCLASLLEPAICFAAAPAAAATAAAAALY